MMRINLGKVRFSIYPVAWIFTSEELILPY